MRDLVEGVLEDSGSKESLPVDESGKRGSLSLAREGRRSITSCGAGVATRGVLPSYSYSGLNRTVILSNDKAKLPGRLQQL